MISFFRAFQYVKKLIDDENNNNNSVKLFLFNMLFEWRKIIIFVPFCAGYCRVQRSFVLE